MVYPDSVNFKSMRIKKQQWKKFYFGFSSDFSITLFTACQTWQPYEQRTKAVHLTNVQGLALLWIGLQFVVVNCHFSLEEKAKPEVSFWKWAVDITSTAGQKFIYSEPTYSTGPLLPLTFTICIILATSTLVFPLTDFPFTPVISSPAATVPSRAAGVLSKTWGTGRTAKENANE